MPGEPPGRVANGIVCPVIIFQSTTASARAEVVNVSAARVMAATLMHCCFLIFICFFPFIVWWLPELNADKAPSGHDRYFVFFVFTQATSAWSVVSPVQGVFRRPITPKILKYFSKGSEPCSVGKSV